MDAALDSVAENAEARHKAIPFGTMESGSGRDLEDTFILQSIKISWREMAVAHLDGKAFAEIL